MKTNVTFKTFDIVKLTATSDVLNTHPNAKDFFGIVREIGASFSFVEWYNRKNSNATAEASIDLTWVPNSDLEPVGSLYHLIEKGLTPATPAENMTAAVAKPKRKYTRKEGAAKPGPKPKKEKVVKVKPAKAPKMTKAEKKAAEAAAAAAEEAAKGPEIVEFPVDGYGNKIDRFVFRSSNYGMATGKFKYFQTREDIERSVRQSGCRYWGKIDGSLDFIIIGEKPGPAKIQKLDTWYKSRVRITEKQWLALIGSPKFKFSEEDEARVINRPAAC